MCAILTNQHHRSRTIQVIKWLYIRKIKMVFLCRHMHRRSCCHDRTIVWFNFSIKEVAPENEFTHCIIHREMLASRKMCPELNSVLTDVVKVINYIKAHALNLRLFEQLCEEMDAERKRLLLHTEIRWLSRGKSLT